MTRALALAVCAVVTCAPLAARAEIQKNGPELFPGKNEISLHVGGQSGIGTYTVFNGQHSVDFVGGTPGGFRFTFDYGRLLSDQRKLSIWLDAGFNFVVNGCNV